MMPSHTPRSAITSLRHDVIPHYDGVIPECYATNTPFIIAWTTSAKQTSSRTENKQGSREPAWKAAETREGRQIRRQGQVQG